MMSVKRRRRQAANRRVSVPRPSSRPKDLDGDKADCYRPVKRTKVVRMLKEPESRPEDDSHDVLDALEATALDLEEAEGERGDVAGSDKDQRKRGRAG